MDSIWDFIKRNLFTIVIIATLIVAMPWLGYIFVIPLIIIIVFALAISWRLYQIRKQFKDETHRQQGEPQQNNWWQRQQKRREGEVTIIQTEHTEQKVSDDVGEYVEFKEIDNDKDKA